MPAGWTCLLFMCPSISQRGTFLILEPYTMAMLPIAHLTSRIDPFDRYCAGSCALDEPYRAVVNVGVRAYQLHTYLAMVKQYFGPQTARVVHEHQLDALKGVNGAGRGIEYALELIVTALETRSVCIPTVRGDVEVPLEMNVALLLLLDDPQSPDFVPDPAQRSVQIGQIGKDVDWCFAQGLSRGREAIADAFVPMFSEGLYSGCSTGSQ